MAFRAANDERQAKRNGLADKLTVEAKALANLKIERPMEGERRMVEADLGPGRLLGNVPGHER